MLNYVLMPQLDAHMKAFASEVPTRLDRRCLREGIEGPGCNSRCPGLECCGHVVIAATATTGNDGDVDGARYPTDHFEVISFHSAVTIDAIKQDFTSSEILAVLSP